MKKIPITNVARVNKALHFVQTKIKIKVIPEKHFIYIDGTELEEYTAEKIIEAIDFGFEPEDALMLKNEDFSIDYINIKEHTHRKNLAEIRARVVGTEGKAKRAIETLTGSVIVLHDSKVGVISDSAHEAHVCQAIVSLIQGAKHGNVFAYLEKQNAVIRNTDEEDLGLKDPKKDMKNLE